MSSHARFRAMAAVAGTFGLALLMFAVFLKSMQALLFVIAAAVFLLALTFSLMARRPVV